MASAETNAAPEERVWSLPTSFKRTTCRYLPLDPRRRRVDEASRILYLIGFELLEGLHAVGMQPDQVSGLLGCLHGGLASRWTGAARPTRVADPASADDLAEG